MKHVDEAINKIDKAFQIYRKMENSKHFLNLSELRTTDLENILESHKIKRKIKKFEKKKILAMILKNRLHEHEFHLKSE